MRLLIFTIGSAGDVFPFIALGVELQRRGHQVTLITGGYYETAVRKAGLDFSVMYSDEEFNKIMVNPDLFQPLRGLKLVYRQMCLPWVSLVYNYIAKQYTVGEVGVVASTVVFGALAAQEKLHVPTVTVHLQPFWFRSNYETPIYPGLAVKNLPRQFKPLFYRSMDLFIDSCIATELNAFRGSLGLAPIHRFFANWIHSPDRVLGLFPAWFAAPQPDWPTQTRLVGFPLYDGHVEHPLSVEVNRFLEIGEAPIIFTVGSPTKQGQWFFEAAVEACERLGCRGLLVNRFRDQVPATLSERVLYAPYVPYGAVFRRSRVVVHHGGIGTVAQAFAAGVPQVIVPITGDMPDNAARMERLGVGLQISRKRFCGKTLADTLRRVLNDSSFKEKARATSLRVDGPKAVAMACDIIEETFHRGRG